MQPERPSKTDYQAAAFQIGSARGYIMWIPFRYAGEGCPRINPGKNPGKCISLDVWGGDYYALRI